MPDNSNDNGGRTTIPEELQPLRPIAMQQDFHGQSEKDEPLHIMVPPAIKQPETDNANVPDLFIERKALTITSKQRQYVYEPPEEKDLSEQICSGLKMDCSSKRIKKFILARFPILKWLPNYNIKDNLLGDFIAGITVAVMHIPQGMAYAMLAGLAPINGIYMAFFPVLVYAIFGTSKHCSIGTFAVVCIMTGKVVHELAIPIVPEERAAFLAHALQNNMTVYTNVEVATIVSFSVAVWLMILGLLQLGTLSVFFSDMLVSGFTTGASIHVLTSQVKHLFGLKIPTFSGPFKIIYTYRSIIGQLLTSNWATVTLSVICLTLLILNNELVKPRLQKITRIPVPIELILVILGTIVSYFGHFHSTFNVHIVGHIPTGLPQPKLPPFSLFTTVMVDSLIIAIVSYTISFAMAKILAKNKYKVNPTQELYAQSLADFVGSFFACAPISVSLSRSLIQTSVGGVTQLTSVISCSLLLLVLLFLGPYFETLPNCVLASIILVALKGMLLQFGEFFNMLKISYMEAGLWLATFLTVVVIDIDYGLFVGIVLSCLMLICRNQVPFVRVLGRVPNTELYLDKDRYAIVSEISDFKICEVAGNLHFANQSAFKKEIIQKTGLNPQKIQKKNLARPICETEAGSNIHLNGQMKRSDSSYTQDVSENGQVITYPEVGTQCRKTRPSISKAIGDKTAIISRPINKKGSVVISTVIALPVPRAVKYLVLDMCAVSRADISAAKNLVNIYTEFAEAGIVVAYTGLSETILETMSSCDCLKKIPETLLFHSVHDAVSILIQDSATETVHL